MIFFLYSDKNCEYQAISCIKSLENKILDDITIVYYTIGFDSDFICKNLKKIRIEYRSYPTFHFYKSELSVMTMDLFPDEQYFIFSDTDVLYSRRFEFKNFKNDEDYPLASFGPHEYPFMWYLINNERVVFDETKLMKYFGVEKRTLRYQWSCFYSFNRKSYEFFEEFQSMCQNKYLLDRRKSYFPFADETAFNVCLWKRNVQQSYGFIFLNTHSLKTVIVCEENNLKDKHFGNSVDDFGADWEYIYDSNNIVLYHGFKEFSDINETLNYLLKNG